MSYSQFHLFPMVFGKASLVMIASFVYYPRSIICVVFCWIYISWIFNLWWSSGPCITSRREFQKTPTASNPAWKAGVRMYVHFLHVKLKAGSGHNRDLMIIEFRHNHVSYHWRWWVQSLSAQSSAFDRKYLTTFILFHPGLMVLLMFHYSVSMINILVVYGYHLRFYR